MKKILIVLLASLFALSGCSSDSKKEVKPQADIVIIGAGGAGMAAAIKASDAGSSVVILEQLSYAGGNTIRSEGGMNAAETIYQAENSIDDTIEAMIEDTLTGGKNINDVKLVEYFVKNTAPTIDWLTSIGMDVSDVAQGAGASFARMHRPADGSKIGGVLVPVLLDNLNQRNITILFQTTANEIVLTDGIVTGVIASDKDGNKVNFDANAVVIATGGFGANEEVYTEYRPDLKGFTTTNHPGATGSGIIMAQEVGADVVDMDKIQTNPTVEITSNTVISESVRGKGTIMINTSGDRFVSEMETRDVLSTAILNEQDKVAYLVFDQRVMDSMVALKVNFEKGIITKGETIEELGSVIGVDSTTLAQTINSWNDIVASKSDTQFGRTTGMDEDLSLAPYYAIKIAPAVHYTMGGVKINTNTEVIDTNNEIIKGLYAAGEVTGGLHGANRLGGHAVADIMVFGTTAGIQANLYVAELEEKQLQLPVDETNNEVILGDYLDGEYTASAKGRNGDIIANITVVDKNISEITFEHVETDAIFQGIIDIVIPQIIQKQSTDVDSLSGATVSFDGAINAINNALETAK